jgi:predicted small secreted protein
VQLESARGRAVALAAASAAMLAGCSTSLGFGDEEDGVGVKSSVAKDGKILVVEPTDGEGKPR